MSNPFDSLTDRAESNDFGSTVRALVFDVEQIGFQDPKRALETLDHIVGLCSGYRTRLVRRIDDEKDREGAKDFDAVPSGCLQ